MNRLRFRATTTTVVWMLAVGAAVGGEKPLAFPTAEGFGALARGGRGGAVLLVTNLEDYLPGREPPVAGSLRAACDANGPRIVVFRVSGTIPLKTKLTIVNPYITIAGQSAPGGGVCLKNYGVSIKTHDIVLRHMRVRPGDELGPLYKKQGKGFSPDGISVAGGHDIIIDHCSVSWAIDECLSVSGAGITDVTVQWCIISESLNDSYHEKGPHGYGSLLRCNGDVSFHHNLYAHHSSRSPRPGTYGEGCILLDFRNNVIHDSNGYSAADPVRMNYVGNFIKRPRSYAFSIGGPSTRLYVAGNRLFGDPSGDRDNWRLIRGAQDVHKAAEPFAAATVTTDTAEEACARVISQCGATLPERDAVDRRVVAQLKAGRGGLIDSQQQVGGWPNLRAAPAPADTDRDGMPDEWEIEQKLNANDAADADGYTN